MANEEGLDETQVSNISLVATEICTNLLKHAQRGEVFLSRLSGRDVPGVEVLAIDRGPGMTDVAQCLVDGYSSANTPGTGPRRDSSPVARVRYLLRVPQRNRADGSGEAGRAR